MKYAKWSITVFMILNFFLWFGTIFAFSNPIGSNTRTVAIILSIAVMIFTLFAALAANGFSTKEWYMTIDEAIKLREEAKEQWKEVNDIVTKIGTHEALKEIRKHKDTYIHKKSQVEYVLDSEDVLVQINDEWLPAIIYSRPELDKYFVRIKRDFFNSFTKKEKDGTIS